MKANQVAALARDEIDRYKYPLTASPLLGKPWSLDKVAAQIESLRKALVLPSVRRLVKHREPDTTVWLVALDGSTAVYFDEQSGDFGLGDLKADGSINDWNVRGGFVGTYCAR